MHEFLLPEEENGMATRTANFVLIRSLIEKNL
jgi:hypothetical protein